MKRVAPPSLNRDVVALARWRRVVPALLALVAAASPPAKPAPDAARPKQLVPELAQASPRLRFHLGEVAGGAPKLSPLLPNMPFTPSAWYVAQWQQPDFVSPSSLVHDDASLRDRQLGLPSYAFKAQDGHASVALFRDGRRWLYRLSERGGELTTRGGANLFLATPVLSPAATLAARIDVELRLRLSGARAVYDKPAARAPDGVLGQVFSGYGLLFRDPVSGARQFVFMQLPIADSVVVNAAGFHICSMAGGAPRLLYVPPFDPGQPPLPYTADNGPLHTLRYRLDRLTAGMLSRQLACQGGVLQWTAAQRDLANWTLTQFYIGLETSNRDMRPSAHSSGPQGEVFESLDLADVTITRSPG